LVCTNVLFSVLLSLILRVAEASYVTEYATEWPKLNNATLHLNRIEQRYF